MLKSGIKHPEMSESFVSKRTSKESPPFERFVKIDGRTSKNESKKECVKAETTSKGVYKRKWKKWKKTKYKSIKIPGS